MLLPLSEPFRNVWIAKALTLLDTITIEGTSLIGGKEDADHSGIRLYAVGELEMIGGGGRFGVGA